MMIPEDSQGQEYGGTARGLGPLFSGLIAAVLIALTLLVAVALGMGEQQMTARVEPTATETQVPPTVTSSPSPSPSPTFTAIAPVEAASSTPSSTSTSPATASVTPTPQPTRTPRPTRVNPTATNCVENPWRWDDKWIVKSGDTLYSIAKATGTTTSNLMTANCLTNTIIHIGQELWVPSLPVPPTRTPSVPAPEIISFTLDPTGQVLLGECVQIDWIIEGEVEEITLTAGGQELVSDGTKIGSFLDCPSELGSRSYLLRAIGPGGYDGAIRSIVVVDELVPTATAAPTDSPTPTNTPTSTNTPTPTNTPTSTNTPTPTATPTPTNTPEPEAGLLPIQPSWEALLLA